MKRPAEEEKTKDIASDVKQRDNKKNKKSKEKSESKEEKIDGATWLKTNEICIEDASHPEATWQPFTRFKDMKKHVDKRLLAVTKKFDRPTPIQSVCWPIQLKQRDAVGIAETGSGKTMAFCLPALSAVLTQRAASQDKKSQGKLPLVLVLAPTRELALQIHEQFTAAGESIQARSICIFGGVPKYEQRQRLQAGVDVVIACPGRLLDLCQEGACDLSMVSFAVLDEADRMLDLGFEDEVRRILSMAKPKGQRQTLMFSATWPTSIQKLAHEFLHEPVKVTVGSPDLTANQKITQIVEVLSEPRDKENKLLALLKTYHASRKNRVLVFALYKKEAARLETVLKQRGWSCVAIHGDMAQNQRNASFAEFKSGNIPLLIATDVAARGLDIPNVEYVINVTFPLTIEDYIHRIGRTGRAGKTGIAHTFFTTHDKARAGELINVLKEAEQQVPESLLAFGTTVKKKEHAVYGAFFRDVDANVKGTKITFDNSDDEQ